MAFALLGEEEEAYEELQNEVPNLIVEELENLVEVMKKRNRQVGHTDGWYMGGAIMINIVEKRLSELKGEQR